MNQPDNVNIQEMSAVELKALAYDQMAGIERLQINIRGINEELAKRNGQVDKREEALKSVSKK